MKNTYARNSAIGSTAAAGSRQERRSLRRELAGKDLINGCELAKRLVLEGALSVEDASFELFSSGYSLEHSGHKEDADKIYQNTIDFLEEVSASKPGICSPSMVSSLAFSHGKKLIALGRFELAVASFKRSLEGLEPLLKHGANLVLMEQRGLVLSWLGIAKRKSGEFLLAEKYYRQALEIWEELPGKIGAHRNPYQPQIGACLMGYSKTLIALGNSRLAAEKEAEARKLLAEELRVLGTRY